jgi:hypothetical protein
VSVTCVFASPLAPHVSSLALDVVVEIPADWPAGRPFHTVAYARPVDGQAGERVPASDEPCDPRTIALTTPTDNDAGLLILWCRGPSRSAVSRGRKSPRAGVVASAAGSRSCARTR